METNDAEEYSSEYLGTKISMEEASYGLRLVHALISMETCSSVLD